MATLITKNSSTAAAVPGTGDLVQGELAVNVTDKKLFTKDAGGNVVVVGQEPLISGTNIKTVGGTSILGSGNISVGTGDVTLTGTQTLTNKTLTDPAIIGTILEDIFTITDGAAFEIDPGNGSVQLITLGANRTPKATNFVNGEAVTLMVEDGTAFTLTWTDSTFGGSGVVWKTDNGSAPTLNTTGYTVVVLFKVGGQVYGARVGNA